MSQQRKTNTISANGYVAERTLLTRITSEYARIFGCQRKRRVLCHSALTVISLLCFSMGNARLNAQTLTAAVTFKGSDPAGCSTPVPTTVFNSSDVAVRLYFFVSGMNTKGGDLAELHWYDPSGNWSVKTTWNATGAGYASWCFWADLNISQWVAPNHRFGQWKVQAYINGKALGSPVAFTVTGPAETQPTDPTLSVSWTTGGAPPSTVVSGSGISLAWQVSGSSSVQSRVCYGTDPNPHNCQQQTAWSGGTGTISIGFLVPTVDLATYWFVVEAIADGKTAWSAPARTVVTGTFITSANQWVYGTDAYGNPQNGWWAQLVKTPVGGARYKYDLYIFVPGIAESIRSASAAVITDLHIGMVRGSYMTEITEALLPRPSQIDLQWQNPPNLDPANSIANVAFDIFGFVNPTIGAASGITDILNNLRDLAQPHVAPSPWLINKMYEENMYRVSRMAYTSNGFFSEFLHISGVKFTLMVDEYGGLQPEFFLRGETGQGKVIGVEIGLDRKAIITSASF